MAEMYRLFIAIDLPDEVKETMSKVQKELIDSESVYGNFINIKNCHITLKFIGLMSSSELEEIKQGIKAICRDSRPFKVSLKDISAFPDERIPKVIWIGVEQGVDEMAELKRRFNEIMVKYRVKPDLKFGAHVTLVRVKKVVNREELNELFKGYTNKDFGSFDLEEIKLMRSELRREGPIYTTLETFRLD